MTWESNAWLLDPVEEHTGPFARREFLLAVGVFDEGEVRPFVSDTAALSLRVDGHEVTMTGSSDLCDYRSPLGGGAAELVADAVQQLGTGLRFLFDSLPLTAAEVVAKGLTSAGLEVETEPHVDVAVVELPGDFEQYLEQIGKKQRHELRRKGRRYVDQVGDILFERCTDDAAAMAEFVRLHRAAAGEKGDFMTPELEGFFETLYRQAGWGIDALWVPGTTRTASAALFSYVDETGYYLYNSSYDPELADASPGNVALTEAIRGAVDSGLGRFDFLKGDEHYKFRLGAVRRPLFQVRAES